MLPGYSCSRFQSKKHLISINKNPLGNSKLSLRQKQNSKQQQDIYSDI